MPYDSQKTVELLKVALLQRNQPNGEFVLSLAQQLRDAHDALGTVGTDIFKAQEEKRNADRQLFTEGQLHKETRDKLEAKIAIAEAKAKAFSDALESIVKDARGAKKIATAALAAPSTDHPTP